MTTTGDPARWRRLAALFDRAVELDPPQRPAFVARECGDDDALRAELEAMLAADARSAVLDAGLGACATGGDDGETGTSRIGARLGPYRIEAVLGRGGMGVVYRASRVDGEFEQQVAIKQLHQRLEGSAHAAHFLVERSILAGLTHPYLAQLLDGGVDEHGQPWFAMELVEGDPLTAWCDAHRLSLRARLDLFRKVCSAVQHAHVHFIVHRDLKPGNILVDGEGNPHVLDFGVAKLLDAEAGGGDTIAAFTPEYAAPEQVTGGAISAATDVFSLGVVLFQLLSGRLPYLVPAHDLRAATEAITSRSAMRLEDAITAGSAEDAAGRLRDRDTSLPGFRRFVRGDLGRIVQTALAKEPQRRYPSVDAFSRDLQRFLQGRTVTVTGDGIAYRARTFIRRNRWGVAMAGVAGTVLVAGIAGVLWQMGEAQAQAARAASEAQRAEVQAARAQLEVRRVNAVNEFLGNVFAAADPMTSGGASKQVSLRDALDLAIQTAEGRILHEPDLAIRVLLAASHSYGALGEEARALALAQRALQIQQTHLSGDTEARAAALAQLAYLRGNYEPEQALRWAQESLALRQSNPDTMPAQMRDSIQTVLFAHYANQDYAGALAMNSELQAQLRAAGAPDTDLEWIASQSDRALLLGLLGRDEEAGKYHETAIRLRTQTAGANSAAVAMERLYYAVTLNRRARHAQALAQLDQALPIMQKAEPDSEEVPRARGERGIALLALERAADALPGLQAAHVHGRTHGFQNRQGRYGRAYARALARLGRCDQAREVVGELARRKVNFESDDPHPFDGTGCPY